MCENIILLGRNYNLFGKWSLSWDSKEKKVALWNQ